MWSPNRLFSTQSGRLSVTAVDTTQRQRVYVSNSLSNPVLVIDPNPIRSSTPPFTTDYADGKMYAVTVGSLNA